MVMFNSYVSLPEGKQKRGLKQESPIDNPWAWIWENWKTGDGLGSSEPTESGSSFQDFGVIPKKITSWCPPIYKLA